MRAVARTVAAGALLSAALAGCTNEKSNNVGPSATPAASADQLTRPPTTDTATALPVGGQPVTLEPADFTTDITHPYWPMRPGTRWTYRETDDSGAVLTTAVVVTTRTRRLADGVTARVVRDTVSRQGRIIEDTMDFYAQDSKGNLWYLGEDTAEFEDGKLTSKGGSFEAGVNGAMPGIVLPAHPSAGQIYRQEFYKGQAEDNGEVLRIGEFLQIPLGLYRDTVLTRDTNTLEPDTLEYKFYANGVGPALILDIAGGTGREELVKIDRAPAGAGSGPLGRPNPQ
jgi:hypothetical protein